MSKINRDVLSGKVYAALKEMVAHYRFQPGARVNVEKLSKELGVSRTPVWEAVRRLESEGLLKNIPYRGVFMVEMTLQRALELYQVREVLEGLAGRLAAEYVHKKALGKMAEGLRAQREIVARGDLLSYSQLDFEFHSVIHKLSRSEVLQEMLESLKTKMQPINIQVISILPRLYEDHVEIIQALRGRNPDATERVIRRHNRTIQNQIRREIDLLKKK